MHGNINYLTNGDQMLKDAAFNTAKWKVASER